MRTGRNLRHTLPPRAWMGERADLRVVLVAVGVGLVAVAVRLPQVFARAFWQDEVASARILSEPTLFAMLRQVRATESTPPFWYALGWGVHRLGVPLREVRLLLVLFGALGCVLVVLVAALIATILLFRYWSAEERREARQGSKAEIKKLCTDR